MKKNVEYDFIDTQGEIIEMIPFLRRKRNNSDNDEQKYSDKQNTSNDNSKIDELSFKIEQLTTITEKLVKDRSKVKLGQILEFCTFILVLLTSFGGAFAYLNVQFDNMNQKIDERLTEADIKSLKDSVEKIELWVEGDINNKNQPGADRRLEKIEEQMHISPISINGSDIARNLFYNSNMEGNNSSMLVSLTPQTYLGEDSNGNQYNIEDIINKNVLLTYNEDDKEIYFWGELNEQLYWNGDCLTNAYNSDGTLYGICESTFNKGKREKYRSFYMSSKNDEWIYTDRVCTDNGNLGISEKYFFKWNKTKNFTSSNARIYDLLYIDDFSSKNDKLLLSYYSGYTVNGIYNDQLNGNSHISYEIIFNKDGKVNILYIGQFLNGDFYDHTGNAIEIVYDPSNKNYKYFCYKGTFTKGKRDGNVSSDNYVTQAQIDEILLEKGIKLKLDWYK